MLEQYFDRTILRNQNLLSSQEHLDTLIQLVPDADATKDLSFALEKMSNKTSAEKWKTFKEVVASHSSKVCHF